jgi:hypothetical protein
MKISISNYVNLPNVGSRQRHSRKADNRVAFVGDPCYFPGETRSNI